MSTLNFANINIYYELHGQGQPLVLIPGYACDHYFWRNIVADLAKKFQVLVFDNRASGQTKNAGGDFTLEIMAEDVVALIDKLGLKKPHIVGHSMGGAIAQILARKYADKLDKVVIFNSSSKLNARSTRALENSLQLRKENTAVESFIENIMPWLFSSRFLAVPENITKFKKDLLSNPYPQSVQDQERQLKALTSYDTTAWVREIKAPMLVVASQEDILSLPGESQQLANEITTARYVLIPGGHSSPVEQPEQVTSAILNFL